MKKFTVQTKELNDDICTICITATDDIIKAYEAFNQIVLHSHIMDSETGELYATLDSEISDSGIRTTRYMDNNFLLSLYEAYEYGNTDFEIMEDFE